MYEAWLNNEYAMWIKALQESTVDNFKSHPQVIRMLGEVDIYYNVEVPDVVREIDKIGGSIKGQAERFVYYARKILKCNPKNIVEIGGGCGEFYAIVRALGFDGRYYIYDLPEVKNFQKQYLDEIYKRFELYTEQIIGYNAFCVSLYAIGEFDDETKDWYIKNVIKSSPHGLIVWNSHSGASGEIKFPCKIEPESPLTSPNNKLLTW